MERPVSTLLSAAGMLLILGGFGYAQSSRTSTGNGFDSSGISVPEAKPNPAPPKVKIIQTIVLTPERAWKNAEDRVILARLVAHDRPELEKDKPPIVVKEGTVRFLKDEKLFEVKLETLSSEDQTYIEELASAIRENEKRKTAAKADAGTEKKAEE